MVNQIEQNRLHLNKKKQGKSKMVRLKYAKLLTVLVLAVNVILIFYTWKWFLSGQTTNPSTMDSKALNGSNKQKDRTHNTNKHIKKTITIVFRDFYHFENDLHHSIDSILNLIPNIQIMVIYEDEPYPPLSFVTNYTATHPNVKFINLNFDIRKTSKALLPLTQVRTKYALFVPDSFRFGGRAIIQKMLGEIEKQSSKMMDSHTSITTETKATDAKDNSAAVQSQNSIASENRDGTAQTDKNKSPTKSLIKKIVIIPFASNVKTMSNCCRINVDIANWTMEYIVKNDTRHCDMVIDLKCLT